jgi:hypothetical protein
MLTAVEAELAALPASMDSHAEALVEARAVR